MSEKEIETYIRCFNRRRGMIGINYYRSAFRNSLLGICQPKSKVKSPTLVLWGEDDLALHIDLIKHFNKYVDELELLEIVAPFRMNGITIPTKEEMKEMIKIL